MPTITVMKDELIVQIKTNRDEHRAIFLTAQERYREKWIQLLDERLAEAKGGRPIARAFALPEPQDYTQEYDNALEQLAWEVKETVELEPDDFNRLVLNQWHWARAFAGSTESYIVREGS